MAFLIAALPDLGKLEEHCVDDISGPSHSVIFGVKGASKVGLLLGAPLNGHSAPQELLPANAGLGYQDVLQMLWGVDGFRETIFKDRGDSVKEKCNDLQRSVIVRHLFPKSLQERPAPLSSRAAADHVEVILMVHLAAHAMGGILGVIFVVQSGSEGENPMEQFEQGRSDLALAVEGTSEGFVVNGFECLLTPLKSGAQFLFQEFVGPGVLEAFLDLVGHSSGGQMQLHSTGWQEGNSAVVFIGVV